MARWKQEKEKGESPTPDETRILPKGKNTINGIKTKKKARRNKKSVRGGGGGMGGVMTQDGFGAVLHYNLPKTRLPAKRRGGGRAQKKPKAGPAGDYGEKSWTQVRPSGRYGGQSLQQQMREKENRRKKRKTNTETSPRTGNDQ